MTDTALQKTGAQFCGSCGAAVKAYWNSCAACKAPLEVRPVGSYDPVDASNAYAATSEPAPAPGAPSRFGAPSGADPSATQTIPAWAPVPPPSAWSAAAESSSSPPPPPAFAPSGGYPPPDVRSAGFSEPAPAAPGYAPPPPGSAPLPGADSPGYPGNAAYPPPSRDYSSPQPDWSSTAVYPAPQFPPASPSFQYHGPAKPRSGRSGRSGRPWLVIVIVLVVLLLGAGGFAVASATSLSSKTTDLHNTQATLRTTQKDLAAANAARSQAQLQLSDAQSTVSNQGDEINSYKTCLNDLDTLGHDVEANNIKAADAANAQAQKDCTPLGLG